MKIYSVHLTALSFLGLWILFVLFGCAAPQSNGSKGGPEQGQAAVPGVLTLGLEKDAIVSRFSPSLVREISRDIIEIDDTNFGIEGTWTLGFQSSALVWFSFTGYTSRVNTLEFDSTLERTEILLSQYSEVFGTPLRFTKGLQEFKDPDTYRHQGYQVLHALWDTEDARIIVDFSFIGEGDDYAFLVTIQGS